MFLTLSLFVALAYAGAVAGHPAFDTAIEIKTSTDLVHAQLFGKRFVLSSFQPDVVRRKRQVLSDSDEEDSNESLFCILGCTMQLKAATRQFQSVQTLGAFGDSDENEDGIMKPVNVSALNQFCQPMRPALQCFDACEHSALTTEITSLLEPIRYVCIDRFEDIQNNARCMQKIAPETTTRCNPRCRRYEESVKKLKQLVNQPQIRYFHSPNDIQKILSGTCQSMQCQLDCSDPITRRVCGETAADIIKGIVQKLMSMLQKRYENISLVFPVECRRMAQPHTRRQVYEPEITLRVDQDDD